MNFLQNKSTRALIIIMVALVLLGILSARIYYGRLNASADPRIKKARTLYESYNAYAQVNAFDSVFLLMDSIETVYTSLPHYRNSYETGVAYNNRAASYLTMALYVTDIDDSLAKDSLIQLAVVNTGKSIEIYKKWLLNFEDKSELEIKALIENEFTAGLDIYSDSEQKKFLARRVKEIVDAQTETKRRLSVSYTNLGIIHRHKMQYEEAIRHYKQALELWDRNLTAENNMNILLGRPIKKRSFIQKMFPPKRK